MNRSDYNEFDRSDWYKERARQHADRVDAVIDAVLTLLLYLVVGTAVLWVLGVVYHVLMDVGGSLVQAIIA